jgi:hypothetical protein
MQDVSRISVLHSSFMDYLVKLTAERYQVLGQFPDFTTAVSGTARASVQQSQRPGSGRHTDKPMHSVAIAAVTVAVCVCVWLSCKAGLD